MGLQAHRSSPAPVRGLSLGRGLHGLGCLILLASVGACGGTSGESPPEVPLPEFASAVETHSERPERLERFFVPAAGRTLAEVRRFYELWASGAGWRKLDADEEAWSADSWQEFIDGTIDARVRQLLVHWTDPSASWSLRLAMRELPETGERGVWVIVEPFVNLDDARLSVTWPPSDE